MGKYDRDYLADGQRLPDLLKEIQDIRSGKIQAKEEPVHKEDIKFNKIYVVDKKFNFIGAILGILFLISFFSVINSKTIFAKTVEEKISISGFEKNKNSINMMSVISDNISELTKKEIILNNVEIPFETVKIKNDKLPLGEENVLVEGVLGNREQTIVKTYERDKIIKEELLNEIITLEPIDEEIEVGTSEYLKEKNVHLGDTMYTLQELYMYEEPDEDSDQICKIYQYIDVVLETEDEGWSKVTVDGIEGYVKNQYLTTEEDTPGIKEACRMQRIFIKVSPEMKLNEPSGLTKEDFKRMFSNQPNDEYKIFKDNAEVFYEVEQKYNVNGIFLASIAVHESNWGRSTIAQEKNNLFGYGSYDESAYESSFTFDSYAYGIDLVGKSLAKYYLNEAGTELNDGDIAEGTYYNGYTIGDVNMRYASDPEWSNKIYNTMVKLYEDI